MTTPKLAGYTAGPWTLAGWGSDDGLEMTGPDGLTIATFSGAVEADARLIAAAPDLLRERDELREALAWALEHVAEPIHDGENGNPLSQYGERYRDARALLARVKP